MGQIRCFRGSDSTEKPMKHVTLVLEKLGWFTASQKKMAITQAKCPMPVHISRGSLHNSPRHLVPKDARKTLYSTEETLRFRAATSLSHMDRVIGIEVG